MVISLHPEDRSLDAKELRHALWKNSWRLWGSPATSTSPPVTTTKTTNMCTWPSTRSIQRRFGFTRQPGTHQKLFAAGRALEVELGLTPASVPSARSRESAAESRRLRSPTTGSTALLAGPERGLVLRFRRGSYGAGTSCIRCAPVLASCFGPRGNGLVFEDVEQGIRVKASFVDRQLSKPRLCQRLGAFEPASAHQLEATRRGDSAILPRPGYCAAKPVEGVRTVSRTTPVSNVNTLGAPTDTLPLASVDASSVSTGVSEPSLQRYRSQHADKKRLSHSSSPCGWPSTGERSSTSSPSQRVAIDKTTHPRHLASLPSPAVPETATPVPSGSSLDKGGNEAV